MLSTPIIVLANAGLFILIALLAPTAQRLRLPFPVALACLGLVIGTIVHISSSDWAPFVHPQIITFLQSLGQTEITSEIFLWVFLPILLFEAALEINLRALLDDIAPILLLAVVAVVATTVLAGSFVWWGANYWTSASFSLAACLLVGTIIATTDPAAVISIFRELGAPTRLVRLVEGESLLNDAAAIALSSAFLAIVVSGGALEPGSMAAGFAWDFSTGIVVGVVLANIAGFALSRLDEGGPAEISISVGLAYISYGLSEQFLDASGVVAVVVSGIVFGTRGRNTLTHAQWRRVLGVWGQLAFWGGSLIFVLASMLMPKTLVQATMQDAFLLVLLLVGATLARALVLMGILPLSAKLGLNAKVTRDQRLVMFWGGLRGAVTLALALAVSENEDVNEHAKHLAATLATGFVLFTLLVQGTTLRAFMRYLGIDKLADSEVLLRNQAIQLTHRRAIDELSRAARSYGFSDANTQDLEAMYQRRLAALTNSTEIDDITLRPQLISALVTLSRRERQLYLQERRRRMMSRSAAASLIYEASALVDALRSAGLEGYRQEFRRHGQATLPLRFCIWLQWRLHIEWPLARLLGRRLEANLVRRYVLSQLLSYNENRLHRLFGERVEQSVRVFIETRLSSVDKAIEALRLQYPTYWNAFQERFLALAALRLENEAMERMQDENLLPASVVRDVIGELRAKRREIERPLKLDLGLGVSELIGSTPIFEELSPANRKRLAKAANARLVLPGERIIRQGMHGDAMYIIASGAVEVKVGENTVRLGTGDFFGELALLTSHRRNADVTAMTYCRLVVLSRDPFFRLLEQQPEIGQTIRAIASQRLEQAT